MAEEKDFDIDLKSLFDVQDGDGESVDLGNSDVELDDFLDDVAVENKSSDFSNASKSDDIVADDIAGLQETTPADFASFDIDDFDAALNSYQAARAGKLPKNAPQPAPMPVKKPEPVVEAIEEIVLPESTADVVEAADVTTVEDLPVEHVEQEELPVEDIHEKVQKNRSEMFNPATVDESGFVENTAERQQEILNWYTGELKDKTYEVSPDNMPEFLDSDKTIRIIHVTTESCYGWNVFFDNGVFMNLHDLKEYQERHGEMPYQDGKIIYGNKTINFERILKIVVYEKPRYFSYVAK